MTDELIQHNKHGLESDADAVFWLWNKVPGRDIKLNTGLMGTVCYSVTYTEDGISYAFNAFVGD